MRRAFLQTNTSADDRFEDFVAEGVLNLRADVPREGRPFVVKRDQDT